MRLTLPRQGSIDQIQLSTRQHKIVARIKEQLTSQPLPVPPNGKWKASGRGSRSQVGPHLQDFRSIASRSMALLALSGNLADTYSSHEWG